MTRYLSSLSLDTLLADLANNGFVFKDEEGNVRPPNRMEVIRHEQDDCIYLEHIPLEDGTESADFCANVTACEGMVFETEIPEPSTPYNKFAE